MEIELDEEILTEGTSEQPDCASLYQPQDFVGFPVYHGMPLNDIDKMIPVVILAISPFALKQPYSNEYLNRCASYAGLLPQPCDIYFDPCNHNALKEIECCNMVSFVQTVVDLMIQDALGVHKLMNITAGWIIRGYKDIERVMIDAQRLFVGLFKEDVYQDEKFVALFVIVLYLALDVRHSGPIFNEFKHKLCCDSEEYSILQEKAKQFLALKNYTQALMLYKLAVQIRPFDYLTYGNLAKVYRQTQQFQYADWCATRALWLNPSCYKGMHSWQQARKTSRICETISQLTYMTDSYFINMETTLGAVADEKKLKTPLITANTSSTSCAETSFAIHCASNFSKLKLKAKEMPEALLTTTIPDDLPSLVAEDVPPENCAIKWEISIIDHKRVSKKNTVKDSNVLKPKNSCRYSTYCQLVKDGSEALMQLSFKVACAKYASAIGILKSCVKQSFPISLIDEILLKYCYAKSCLGNHTYKDIEEGLKEMDAIITDYSDMYFPLAYYGMTLGHLVQNNFKEAKNFLLKLVDILKKDIITKVYEYPCCEDKIEESRPEKLKEFIDEIMLKCNNPPPPDAKCYHSTSHRKSEIYCNEPEFQGFIRFTCQDRCNVDYHPYCWKNVKDEKKIYRDKEYLGKQCFTPDCGALISSVELFGANGNIRKTLYYMRNDDNEELLKRHLHLSSNETITDTRVSKHNILKDLQVLDEARDNSSIADYEQRVAWTEAVPDTRKDPIFIIQGKKYEMDERLAWKMVHRKKSKRKFLPNFLENDSSPVQQLDCEKQYIVKDALLDFREVNRMHFDMHEVQDVPCTTTNNRYNWLESKSERALIDFLKDYVRSYGPTLITNQRFIQELCGLPLETQQLIIERGGVKNFLMSCSPNIFDIIGNYIVLPMHLRHINRNSSSLINALDLAIYERCFQQFFGNANEYHDPCQNVRISNLHTNDSMEKSSLSETSSHVLLKKVKLMEEENKRLIQEYRAMNDKLIHSQKELSMSRDACKKKIETLHGINKDFQKLYDSLLKTYEDQSQVFETEKLRSAEEMRMLREKNEMLVRQIERMSDRERNFTATILLRGSLLDKKSKLLSDAEDTIQTLIQKLEIAEQRYQLYRRNEDLHLCPQRDPADDQRPRQEPHLVKPAASGSSQLSSPNYADTTKRKKHRLKQSSNSEYPSSPCHGFQLCNTTTRKRPETKLELSTSVSRVNSSGFPRAICKPVSTSCSNIHAIATVKTNVAGGKMPKKCASSLTISQPTRYRSEECNICLDKLDDSDIDYLSCGHAYHNTCIRKWFNTRSTCPTCGRYVLLDDEYPPLG